MRTVTYKSVEEKANILFTGKVRPNADDAASLNRFINARYKEYFERFFWPEWTVVEKRTFRQPYGGSTVYAATHEVYYWPTQAYYQALRAPLIPVNTLTRSTVTATATVSGGHQLTVGSQPRVTISGVTPTGYNGTWMATVTSGTQFTYTMPSDPVASGSGTMLAGIHPADAADQTVAAYWAASEASYTADDWQSATSYPVGAQVYQPLDGYHYQCITAHTNQSPPNATYWGRLTEFVRDIDYTGGTGSNQGTTATSIGEVKAIWPANPRTQQNLLRIDFEVTGDGIVVRGDEPVVWVEFRLRPNDFTGSTWAAGSFAPGDQVYYSATGDYYVCTATATTEVPTDTTKWSKLDFPYVLAGPVAQAALADLLKMSGKTSKYIEEFKEAGRLLQREFDKIERQQGQTTQLKVMTR